MVAGLFSDPHGRVLIVKPAHKEGWIFPGGYVEIGEAPSSAFQRTILTELGRTVSLPVRLLSVDYRGSTDEYVMFIFDGGVFTDEEARTIVLPPHLTEYRFVGESEAMALLRKSSAVRLAPTLEAREKTGIAYLEHQELL